jgi:transposase-like protein
LSIQKYYKKDKLFYKKIPSCSGSVQLNSCSNLACSNYGVEAANPLISDCQKGVPPLIRLGNDYELAHQKKDNQLVLTCKKCRKSTIVFNNKSIEEEFLGISGYCEELEETPSCKSLDCKNYGISILKEPDEYAKNGKNESGGQRYKCKRCNKTCTIPEARTPYSRQKESFKNIDIFKALVNKVPLNRILELNEITPKVLYNKIDYFYKQCRKFARAKNKHIAKQNLGSLRLSSDRQYYITNWRKSGDKRNVMLYNLSTTDEVSSYVFLSSLNFDPEAVVKDINQLALNNGDYGLPIAWRRFAKYRLDDNIDDESLDPQTTPYKNGKKVKGMQVLESYTMAAHFVYLKELLANTDSLTLYNDKEGSIANIIKNIFKDRILDDSLEAFLVGINKNKRTESRNKKELISEQALKEFREFKSDNFDLSDFDAKAEFIKQNWNNSITTNNTKWHAHPTPSPEEPDKVINWITERQGKNINHITPLMVMATLNATDRFFLSLRRRITFFERSISSSSGLKSIGSKWSGYAAYNPAVLIKVLEIFRIYYNFVLTGKDKNTPAQRLGVAKKAYSVRDILYHK